MESDADLAWRIEEACLNAWPSPRHLLIDGYLLRAAGGPSKRVNSVNPLRGAGPAEPAIAACEAIFAGLGRGAIFRVPDISNQMLRGLERRGYRALGETCTLYRDLTGVARTAAENGVAVEVTDAPTADWLALRDAASGHDPDAARAFRTIVEAIVLPRGFATVPGPGGLGAIAFGVVHGDVVVIESVAVPEALRGQGLGGLAVLRLMRWGAAAGATGACLQVEAANAPARALYRRLGFDRELYRYHYRVQGKVGD